MDLNELFLYSLLQDEQGDTILVNNNYQDYLDKAEEYVFIREEEHGGDLLSIFQFLDSQTYPDKDKIDCKKVAIDNGWAFPKDSIDDLDSHLRKYNQGKIRLKTHYENINDDTAFANTLFFLQRQYLSSVPCYLGHEAISQFEYLKSRTAFAQCLAYANKDTQYPFLIFCGDLSGIQTFIYNIHRSKAAKSMKGRSFYLQLLVESIITNILTSIGVSVANVIYSSGGKFYLLLPNTPKVRLNLQDLEEKIVRHIFDQHGGRLFICMDWIAFDIDTEYYVIKTNDLLNNKPITGIGDLWKGISSKTAKKKQKKFWQLMTQPKRFNDFFRGGLKEKYNADGYSPCAITGEPTKEEPKRLLKKDTELYVSEEAWEQVEIGRQLKDSKFYSSTQNEIELLPNWKENYQWFSPLNLNNYYSFNKNHHLAKFSQKTTINPKNNFSIYQAIQKFNTVGFTFYGGNEQPTKQEDGKEVWKDFEDLAKPDEGQSLNKLGVLRMDVDGLGNIFTNKIPTNLKSFAGYSTLSAQLDWFFSGHLNHIRNRKIAYQNHLVILYAGGDDLCIVGRWKECIEFANDVQEDFKKFIGNREDISISAGLAIVNPKFPISKATDMAGDFLDNHAKKYRKPNSSSYRSVDPDKNAIHLLGQTVSWDKEFEFVMKLKDLFCEQLIDKGISKGFIYKLFEFQVIKNRGELDWWWKSAYTFKKYGEEERKRKRQRKYDNKQNIFHQIKNAILSGEFKYEYKNGNVLHFEVSKGCEGNSRYHEYMLDLICLAGKLADYYSR